MGLINFWVDKEKSKQIENIRLAFKKNNGNLSKFITDMIIKGFEDGSWTKYLLGGLNK